MPTSTKWKRTLSHAFSTINDAAAAVGDVTEEVPEEGADEVTGLLGRAARAMQVVQSSLRAADALMQQIQGMPS